MNTKIDNIQHNVNLAYYGPIFLQENIIPVYQKYSVLLTGLINLLFNTFDIVNLLYSSIINYEIVNKPTPIRNCM